MYYRAWSIILTNMKNQFMEETGLKENAFCCKNEIHHTQEPYCLRNARDNLIQNMDPVHMQEFSAGKSVVEDLSYLASSYAMTFNFLGNRQVKFLSNSYGIYPGKFHIEYKKTFRALQSKNAFVSVDACMFSETEASCVCLEMKLLEWFVFKINPIKDNFMESKNYFYGDTAKVFMDVIQLLIPYLDRDGWEHLGSFQYCDGFLVLRQALGLYNVIRLAKERGEKNLFSEIKRFRKVRHLTLTTVYWYAQNPGSYGTYRERILKAEQQLHKEVGFLREIMEPIVDLFAETLGVDLQLLSIDYKSFLQCLDKTKEEWRALSRYDI